jgi:hypothetical protein
MLPLLFYLMATLAVTTGAPDTRRLLEATVLHQHANDAALYGFERLERRRSFADDHVSADRTYRVVPTGTGTLSLLVRRGNTQVSPAEYRQELENWAQVLRHAINPTDPHQQESERRRRERDQQRAELVDAVLQAFRFTVDGEERHASRTWIRLRFEPEPAFHPRSRTLELLAHVHGTLWIDRDARQVARAMAEIISDIPIGGGLLSQIDRGGWFYLEQSEVDAGIWLPVRIEYAISGRKLLFGFRDHRRTDIFCYRRLGGPQQALAVVQRELSGPVVAPTADGPESCPGARPARH